MSTEPPSCILTGQPGENADDCTTHDHEDQNPRFILGIDPGNQPRVEHLPTGEVPDWPSTSEQERIEAWAGHLGLQHWCVVDLEGLQSHLEDVKRLATKAAAGMLAATRHKADRSP